MRAAQPAAPGRAQPAARPPLRVVRRRSKGLIQRRGGRKLAPWGIAGVIGVVALIFGILLEQVILAQSAFHLTELRQQIVEVETRHEELLLEAARLESPDRIERYARSVLGMVDPRDHEYVVADVPLPGNHEVGAPPLPETPASGVASGELMDVPAP